MEEKEKKAPKKRNGKYLRTQEIYVGSSDGQRWRDVEGRDNKFDKRTDDQKTAYLGFEKRLIQTSFGSSIKKLGWEAPVPGHKYP